MYKKLNPSASFMGWFLLWLRDRDINIMALDQGDMAKLSIFDENGDPLTGEDIIKTLEPAFYLFFADKGTSNCFDLESLPDIWEEVKLCLIPEDSYITVEKYDLSC